MIQVYIEGAGECKVANVEVNDIKEINIGEIIEMDNRAWGGCINRYKVISIESQKIIVEPSRGNKIMAYPTANSILYK